MATNIDSFFFPHGLSLALSEVLTLSRIGTSYNLDALTTTFTHGTGTAKINKLHVAEGTITAGANLDISLASSLTDLLKNSAPFTYLKFIFFLVTNTTLAGTVTFANSTVSNPLISWSIPVFPLSDFLWFSATGLGIAVGANHNIRITAPGSTSNTTYRLVLGGEG